MTADDTSTIPDPDLAEAEKWLRHLARGGYATLAETAKYMPVIAAEYDRRGAELARAAEHDAGEGPAVSEPMPTGDAFLARYYTPSLISPHGRRPGEADRD